MTEYIQGIDVSYHQGTVDHDEVAGSGMNFCYVKATEGRNYEDPRFAENIANIRITQESGAVYYPGAYHFARPDSTGGAADGVAEAEDFCDVVQRVCGDIRKDFLPPVLDFEKYSESDLNENIPWIDGWIEVVERRLGRMPMIYTGANVWRYEVGNTDAFIDYPLWQVYYSGTATRPPDMPWPGNPQWTMWQYSGGGSYQHHPAVPGVGVVDVNRFYGDLDQLVAFANGELMPTTKTWPTPPITTDLNFYRGTYSDYVARVQGLLLSYGYGPDGLTDSSGKIDGRMGGKTENYLKDFKSRHDLAPDAVMDWPTWWALTYDKL